MRPAVGRQFEHQWRLHPFAGSQPEDAGHRHGTGHAADVEAEEDQSLQIEDAGDRRLGNERGDDQGVYRQSRRTGHQRCDHDRRQPVAPVRDGARRHDAGNGAGKARQQGNERSAGKADGTHQAVEEESGAGQIARILEGQDEQEENQDLRQEDEDAADAGDDAVDQKAAQDGVRHPFADRLADHRDAFFDQFHRQAGPAEYRLEHQEQRCCQNEHSPDRVQDDAVDPVVEARVDGRLADCRGQDASHLALRRADVGDIGRQPGCRGRPRLGERGLELADQLIGATPLDGDRADDRHCQLAGERRHIDDDAASLRQVGHVQRDNFAIGDNSMISFNFSVKNLCEYKIE